MEVTVLNWKKFNPREDVKRPSWFRLENNLFADPQFFDFSGDELLAWIYILAHASQKNGRSIQLNKKHVERVGKVKFSSMQSAIEKLQQMQCVQLTERTRNVDVTDLHATNERDARTDVHGTRESDDSPTRAVSEKEYEELSQIWNKYSSPSQPKFKTWNSERRKKAKNRWRETPTDRAPREYWVEVVGRIAAWDFGNGSSGWFADFDYLLRPNTHIRAMEGALGGDPAAKFQKSQSRFA